jgi:peroxiredoxin
LRQERRRSRIIPAVDCVSRPAAPRRVAATTPATARECAPRRALKHRAAQGAQGGTAMAIKVGDRIPSATLKEMTPDGIKDVKTDDLFRGKKVVLFAVPGAFTPLCSAQHLPGFVDKADALRAKGVDEVVCVSVNDAFVMDCWGKDRNVGSKVRLMADGNAEFTRALGSQRYAAIVDDGKLKLLNVEKPGKFEASKAETILGAL